MACEGGPAWRTTQRAGAPAIRLSWAASRTGQPEAAPPARGSGSHRLDHLSNQIIDQLQEDAAAPTGDDAAIARRRFGLVPSPHVSASGAAAWVDTRGSADVAVTDPLMLGLFSPQTMIGHQVRRDLEQVARPPAASMRSDYGGDHL